MINNNLRDYLVKSKYSKVFTNLRYINKIVLFFVPKVGGFRPPKLAPEFVRSRFYAKYRHYTEHNNQANIKVVFQKKNRKHFQAVGSSVSLLDMRFI